MIDLTAENIFVCLTILLSTLLLYGFWKLINEALPGDQEMLVILKHERARKANTHQQSCQIIEDAILLAEQKHQLNTSRDEKKDDPAGIRTETELSSPWSYEFAQSRGCFYDEHTISLD
jgi:hypothetical protein